MNYSDIIDHSSLQPDIRKLAFKVLDGQRLGQEEGLLLYTTADFGLLGLLASHIQKKLHAGKAYFNRNFHIEPTNICVYNCRFCSYRRRADENGSWNHSLEQIIEIASSYKNKPVTEVHITGGVHPSHDIYYYADMVRKIREVLPQIHVKAFSAVELDYMIKKAGMTLTEGLTFLKESGLGSIPGGGAEIFDPEIRQQVCSEKSTAADYLNIHENAHKAGLSSNATMLYGHIENYKHRIDHLEQLRTLQDRTHGFNAFIPLKFRSRNNSLSGIGEVNAIEDMKNFAVCRIYLDNIPHLKAYWPMLGKEMAQLSLSFGVDDIDGTIDDSTKIYSMAGAEDTNPSMNAGEIVRLIRQAGRIPVERDSLYREIRTWIE